MSDPYFQQVFAQRIGGPQYGKGSEIYRFEKIKRAKRKALAVLPAAFIDPGDVTLMTLPGYPVAGTHTKYYGGEVYRLPLLAENDFLPNLVSGTGIRA